MTHKEILSKVDHTLLAQTATWDQIKEICDDAAKYETASVCIPPCYVKKAKAYAGKTINICTVIGFPNGNSTTETKVLETQNAIENGADEIDMVINIGWVKDGKDQKVLEEINAVKEACQGRILKVIVETCLLTEEEKIRMCDVVSRSEAEYIKTSTGFAGGGATFADVELFAKHVQPGTKIKAAGGIKSVADAEKFLELGAERLGTSSLVAMLDQKD